MPFIACLNNVKTTHAAHTPPRRRETRPKNTRPTPNQRMSRSAFRHHPPPGKGANRQRRNTITHSQHTRTSQAGQPGASRRCSRPLCRSQTTTPPTPSTTHRRPRAKGGTEAQPHRSLCTADPSGPNSVPDPAPATSNEMHGTQVNQPPRSLEENRCRRFH